MSLLNDAKRAALNVEEAALLPALPRTRAGGAALRTAMRAAEAMNGMQTGNAVSTSMGQAIPARGQAEDVSAARRALTRAALHQVLRP